jgi:hypothetical protein
VNAGVALAPKLNEGAAGCAVCCWPNTNGAVVGVAAFYKE